MVNSNLVYIIEASNEYDSNKQESLVLKVLTNIKVGEEKAPVDTKMSLYKGIIYVFFGGVEILPRLKLHFIYNKKMTQFYTF